jgi:hypothetical protein
VLLVDAPVDLFPALQLLPFGAAYRDDQVAIFGQLLKQRLGRAGRGGGYQNALVRGCRGPSERPIAHVDEYIMIPRGSQRGLGLFGQFWVAFNGVNLPGHA